MRRALRENGATSVSMATISSAFLLLGRVVTATLSLEAKLMAVSLAWAGMFLLQRVLVGKRHCSDGLFVNCRAMAAYHLPSTLVFGAATSFYYSTTHINEFAARSLVLGILAMFPSTIMLTSQLGVLFTNMRAYSLRGRPADRYTFLSWLFFLVCVDWQRAGVSGSPWIGPGILFVLVGAVAVPILFIDTSKSTLDWETKAFADYMKSSNSLFFDADANNISILQLDHCRYPFLQRKNGQWVTVKDLFDKCPHLVNEHQDFWLSYSLCRLLARRYYGFHCAEEGDVNVRSFVLAGLLGTTDGIKRAFDIVQVQLAFLHDYFYTASLPIIESGPGYTDTAQFTLMSFALIILSFLSATVFGMRDKLDDWIIMLVAWLLIFMSSWCALFGMPMWLLVRNLLAFYWRAIHTALRELKCLPDGPIPIFCLRRLFRASPNPDPFQTKAGGAYWKNKIGQYSIIQDCDRPRSRKKALVDWFHRIVLSEPSYDFIKHLPVEEEEVDMQKQDSMRELVANTLRGINGPPTNGTWSLKKNKDEINRARKNRDSADYDWLWTCEQETHTDTILIWHIATRFCDMTPSDNSFMKDARALSRYCAYLLAFLPEFLPEHSLTTKFVFQTVLQQAQEELEKKHTKDEDKRTTIRRLELPKPEEHDKWTTFHKGVKLGRQLEEIPNDEVRWKVIAEFWAETILYIAPSDNVEAHMERLAEGGEFITHLWAMLSNAGILKRATEEWQPPVSTTTRGPPKKKATTKGTTQECPF